MRPTITHTELFSYLITRPTGRTVRTSIEEQIADVEEAVLAVLDLHHVPLIDFSCADEVVAKLVVLSTGATRYRRFVLFRGIAEHHLEPIQSALSRQGLAAAAETAEGEPLLMGSLGPDHESTWREISSLGSASIETLVDRLSLARELIATVLDELEARALVVRDGERVASLRSFVNDGDVRGRSEGAL